MGLKDTSTKLVQEKLVLTNPTIIWATLYFLLFGVPFFFVSIAFLVIFDKGDDLHDIAIVLFLVSTLFLILGIVIAGILWMKHNSKREHTQIEDIEDLKHREITNVTHIPMESPVPQKSLLNEPLKQEQEAESPSAPKDGRLPPIRGSNNAEQAQL